MDAPKKYALFIGRWQPLHNGHDWLIRQALRAGKPVAIAVRDTLLSEADPYTVEERIAMIREHFKGEDVTVFAVPDIESVNVGRGVGYEVNVCDVPPEVAGISATEIRRALRAGAPSWRERVPAAIADFLETHERHRAGRVLWFTGPPAAGKTTLAERLASRLRAKGRRLAILDGDAVRATFCTDLGYTRHDRDENVRRVAHVAKALADDGLLVLVTLVSPYRQARAAAETLIGPDRFRLVYVSCPPEMLRKRDPKGLYARALAGEVPRFTGVNDPYEPPEWPDLILDTAARTIEECLEALEAFLSEV